MPDYVSGVLTMEQAMQRSIEGKSYDRLMGLSTLLWLALTPVIRANGRKAMPQNKSEAASSDPNAAA